MPGKKARGGTDAQHRADTRSKSAGTGSRRGQASELKSKSAIKSKNEADADTRTAANPRHIAHSVLLSCERDGGSSYLNLALDAAIKKNPLTDADRALLTRLVFGVTERRITLDWYADRLSGGRADTLEPEVLTAVRLGLYQLMFTDKIPAHAAVNESVALSPRRAAGLVNAVLRRYLRETDKITLPDAERDYTAYLSVKYSVPETLCGRFAEIFGRRGADELLAAFLNPPRLTLRVNTQKTSRDSLTSAFSAAGIASEHTPLSPDGILIPSVPLRALPGFEQGAFFVQDEASQLCVRALGAEPGMTVADVCSAPGSKSFGAAIEMKNLGDIHSFDLHKSKLSLIRSGAERLGINIISAEQRDARVPDASLMGRCDRVLCDVPCSGFGVIGKKPEIRYKSLTDAAGLPTVQYDILEMSRLYLKPGGILVYSTCTLLPEENEGVISKFLSNHDDFELSSFAAGGLEVPEGMITLAPHTHGTDGFFIARLTLKR